MSESSRESSCLEHLVDRMNAADADGRELIERLLAVIDVVSAEAVRTPRFSRALRQALEPATAKARNEPVGAHKRRAGRREAGLIDPFEVLKAGGSEGLQERLAQLTVEQLKDVIAEHGMDRDRLAMKWKDSGRLIERIIETSVSRANKGHAFRAPDPTSASGAVPPDNTPPGDPSLPTTP
jgi:hypothetical protein